MSHLEQLQTLPTLVIATVFLFLPEETIGVFEACGNHELGTVARWRRWLRVFVGAAKRHRPGLYHRLDGAVFHRMVMAKEAPPCKIKHLFYDTLFLDSFPFLAPKLREWIGSNTLSFGMSCMLQPTARGCEYWQRVSPEYALLNLVELEMGLHTRRLVGRVPLSQLVLPDTLRKLCLGESFGHAEDYSQLVLPSGVVHLSLPVPEAGVSRLPALPLGLCTLVLKARFGGDLSEDVEYIPRGLGCLAVELELPWTVAALALERFALLRHNLVVSPREEPAPELSPVTDTCF